MQITDNIWQNIFKISVRFTLKELRCEFSSCFDIISGSKGAGIFFANSGYVWVIIIKQKNQSKRKHRIPEFFHRQEEKAFNNLTRNKTSRERVFF